MTSPYTKRNTCNQCWPGAKFNISGKCPVNSPVASHRAAGTSKTPMTCDGNEPDPILANCANKKPQSCRDHTRKYSGQTSCFKPHAGGLARPIQAIGLPQPHELRLHRAANDSVCRSSGPGAFFVRRHQALASAAGFGATTGPRLLPARESRPRAGSCYCLGIVRVSRFRPDTAPSRRVAALTVVTSPAHGCSALTSSHWLSPSSWYLTARMHPGWPFDFRHSAVACPSEAYAVQAVSDCAVTV